MTTIFSRINAQVFKYFSFCEHLPGEGEDLLNLIIPSLLLLDDLSLILLLLRKLLVVRTQSSRALTADCGTTP